MKSTGVICEYNPLHKGHAHLLNQVRGEGPLVCVMSGNFTQRGEAAILPPSARTAMALAAGADLVVELPFPYAASSAAYFAEAGVLALAGLGVERIAFGSESGDLAALQQMAETADPGKMCRNGAENEAVGDAAAYFSALGVAPGSNDILALAYLAAIKKYGIALAPITVQRKGAGYGDAVPKIGEYSSATALRELLFAGSDVREWVPEAALPHLTAAMESYGLSKTARLGDAMLAKLRAFSAESAETVSNLGLAECGGGLLGRLIKCALEAGSYEELVAAAGTKRYTNGRIRRALLFLLAGVKDADLKTPPAYLRLLGAGERGRAFLAKTEKTCTIPVVTKQSEIAALGERAARQRALSLVSDGLYAIAAAGRITPAALQTARPLLF